MNLGPAKTARVLLALALLLAWTLPACAGTGGCTMPCCRAKVQPVSDSAAKPCCQHAAKSACRFTADCPFALPQALTSAAPAAPAGALTAALDTPGAPPLLPADTAAIPPARPGPPFDTPLYLRTLSILI